MVDNANMSSSPSNSSASCDNIVNVSEKICTFVNTAAGSIVLDAGTHGEELALVGG